MEQEGQAWSMVASLDSNVLACVLCHLSVQDLANVRLETRPPPSFYTSSKNGDPPGGSYVPGAASRVGERRGLVHPLALALRVGLLGRDRRPPPLPRTYRVACECVVLALTWLCYAGAQVVPKESNEWQRCPAADVFGLYAARHQRPASTADESVGDTADHGDGEGAERRVDRALHEFVRRHATREGYGGWKSVYKRHETCNDTTHDTQQ